MNNSFFYEEKEGQEGVLTHPGREETLRSKEGDLVKIIEAIGSLSNTREWSTLKTYVFDGALESLEKRLVSEANKMPVNDGELYRLQGQIMWAKKYADLQKLADTFRLELINVRKQLNPPTERVIAQ